MPSETRRPPIHEIANAVLADTNTYDFNRQPFDQGMVNKLLWQRRHLAEAVVDLIELAKTLNETAYPTGKLR